MSKIYLGLFVILLAAVICSPAVLGQTTATIFGVVQDSTGAVLPGAEVTVTQVETGRSRVLISDDEGRYRASNLNVGNYEIEASLPGFQTAARSGVELNIGRLAEVDFTLTVGEITERVTVTGEAPLIQTTSSSLGDLVDRNTVLNLPLNGRDLTALLTLQSGTTVSTSASTGASPGFSTKISISGARPQDNAVLLDGTEVKGMDGGVPAGMAGNFVGIEAIQEFKIERNAYSAQFGGNAGGVINVVSKSGTNDFHGSLYEFHRNDNLDSAKWETNRAGGEKDEFKRNQFGFSIGGPAIRNKTFFFFNYEGLRDRLGVTSQPVVWTDATRNGLLPLVGGEVVTGAPLVPYTIAPNLSVGGVSYLDLWPRADASSQDTGEGTARKTISISQATDENFYQLRVDHNLSDSDSIFGRLTRQTSEQVTPPLFFWATESFAPNFFLTLEEKKIFSPHVLNTFRAAFNRRGQGQRSFEEGLDPSLDVLKFVPLANWQAPLGAQWSQGSIGGTGASGVGLGRGWVDRKINRFQWADDLVWNQGSHSWKFGFDWQVIQHNGANPSRPAGAYTFSGIEDFLLDADVSGFRGDISPNSEGVRGLRWDIFGWYVQDDFQATRNLTLNLGFRHEFFTVPYEVNGKIGNIKDPVNDGLADYIVGDCNVNSEPCASFPNRGEDWFLNPSIKSFAPRIGFAWDPTGEGKMALRGGAGIFWNHIAPGTFRQAVHRTHPWLIETNIRSGGKITLPDGSVVDIPFPGIFDLIASQPIIGDIQGFPYDYADNPSAYQWNLNIQREILANTALTVGYAGTRGLNQVQQVNLNTATATEVNGRWVFPDGAARPSHPDFQHLNLRWRDTSADAWYNSLQVGVQRRFSSGYQYQLSYTFSKTMNTASQINNDFRAGEGATMEYYFDPAMRTGLAPWHVAQSFRASWVAELPLGQGKAFGGGMTGVAQALLGGWQAGGILSLSDGSPVTIDMSSPRSNSLSGLGLGNTQPDLMPGGDNNPVFDGPGRGDLYFDVNQFVLPPENVGGIWDGDIRTIGNLGRATLINPGFAQLDFSLSKSSYATEDLNVEVKFEGFNLLNRANLGTPDDTIFSSSGRRRSSAGRIGSTRGERQIQIGLRLSF